MTATILRNNLKPDTEPVVFNYLGYCFDVTLIHRDTEAEKLITVIAQTDRFTDVTKAIREREPDRRWEIFETIEQPF